MEQAQGYRKAASRASKVDVNSKDTKYGWTPLFLYIFKTALEHSLALKSNRFEFDFLKSC
jgi:hypothetical protein